MRAHRLHLSNAVGVALSCRPLIISSDFRHAMDPGDPIEYRLDNGPIFARICLIIFVESIGLLVPDAAIVCFS